MSAVDIPVSIPEALCPDERQTLCHLEHTIEAGLSTFKQVGDALCQIRAEKLYRDTHQTFERYCSERWALGRQRAYALIDAAKVAIKMSEISDIPVVVEAHAAALALVSPKHRAIIWNDANAVAAAEDRKVTAGDVKRVAVERSLIGVPERNRAAPKSVLESAHEPEPEPEPQEAWDEIRVAARNLSSHEHTQADRRRLLDTLRKSVAKVALPDPAVHVFEDLISVIESLVDEIERRNASGDEDLVSTSETLSDCAAAPGIIVFGMEDGQPAVVADCGVRSQIGADAEDAS